VNHHESQARPPRFTSVRVLAVLPFAAVCILGACSPEGRHVASGRDFRGIEAAERSVAAEQPAARTDRRVAFAAGAPVTWDDLEPAMAEAAGAQALQELVLDRMLAAEMRTRGITITTEDVARERNLVIEQISQGAQAPPDDAERLLASVRARRGLGPTRFDRLLERTARMRKLASPEVAISDEELRQAHAMRHGPRYRSRVITTSSDRRASQLRAELEPLAPAERTLRFTELATRESTDPSAARGGILEPISPADPAYPAGVRAALGRMTPGELSAVVAVESGYAILLLEEVVPGDDKPFEEVRDLFEREVRLRRERLAMDDLARRLIRSADVSVMDRSLHWSWQNALAAPPQ
jgi:hypothetical protein